MAVTESRALVGSPVPRKEDPELLTGQARYVDNLTVPGMVWGPWISVSTAKRPSSG